MSRFYGYRPSPPDQRDKIADLTGLTILPEVDLRKGPMPLVFDQGQLGSCTANAVCAALQYDCSLDRQLAGSTGRCHQRSRLDVYYGERSLEGTLGEDDPGAYGRDGFKYAQQIGVLLEERWPYDISTYAGPPSGYKRHKLTKPYATITRDTDHIKAALSNSQMVAFGFSVYESFESPIVEASGVIPMPKVGEQRLGGHEMLIVGYFANWPLHALVRNSWGSGWNKVYGGYAMMPWAYLTDPGLTNELWTIVRAA